MKLGWLLLAFAAAPGSCQWGGIPECGSGTYHEVYMAKCQERLDAYEPDWSAYRVTLDVTCYDPGEVSAMSNKQSCRAALYTGDVWNQISIFQQVSFKDSWATCRAPSEISSKPTAACSWTG